MIDILPRSSHQELLNAIRNIRFSLNEWELVEIKLTNVFDMDTIDKVTVDEVTNLVASLFRDKDGKMYACGPNEILMLLHWGGNNDPKKIAHTIVSNMPNDSCEVTICPSTKEGLSKIVFQIETGLHTFSMFEMRKARLENIVIVADDDMYMRHLAKMGLENFATIYEVTEGDQVVDAYRKWMPDILFLDIHLPGKMGTHILQEILQIDKSAYVVMLSADSSAENIKLSTHKGAKDFVSKPFTRERLLENMKKCPTLGLEVRQEILKRA